MPLPKPAGALAIALGLASTAPIPAALAQSAAEPLALRGVMQQMDHDTRAAASAIARQDWTAVATLADRLAHHAEPPLTEKVRILGWLLTDASTFRNYDLQVKAAAGAMQAAAQRGDAAAAQGEFARMQQSCDGCHNSFRPKFLKHFYGTP